MDILQLLDFWDYFQAALYWLIPATLAVVWFIQLMYYTYLNATANPPRQNRQRDTDNLPDSPVMPTDPENSININPRARSRQQNNADPGFGVPGVQQTPKFVVLNGLPNVSEIELPANEFGIGRFYAPDKDIHVALDERSVSRRHAMFIANPVDAEYFLIDTHSSYGTSLRRGERFEALTPGQEVRVYNGDVVQFGSVVTVRLALPGDTRAHATQG